MVSITFEYLHIGIPKYLNDDKSSIINIMPYWFYVRVKVSFEDISKTCLDLRHTF